MVIMMSTSRSNYPPAQALKVAITVVFIFCLMFLPLRSVGLVISGQRTDEESLAQRKMVLGSKPPACLNKCLSCRPCVATLVIPSHQGKSSARASSQGADDNYYLLSWKCRCGNKLFQP